MLTPHESDLECEIIRLHAFILSMAERLACASEVLGNRAERRRKRVTMEDARGAVSEEIGES